jgi:hypothetical protein
VSSMATTIIINGRDESQYTIPNMVSASHVSLMPKA